MRGVGLLVCKGSWKNTQNFSWKAWRQETTWETKV